ncbi:hypothetical protein [Streptococcus pneumoniae]|nr:hypothetical protein [Streptococcus pneumoniae]
MLHSDKIITTRQTGGLSQSYKPKSSAKAPKDAGFHVVQALLLLTRHLPL